MRGYGDNDGRIQRRSRRGLAAVIAIALPSVLGVLGEQLGIDELTFVAACLGCIEAVCFFLLPAIAPQGILTGESRGDLRVDRDGVSFRKRLVLPRARIASVWVEVLTEGKRCVHLCGRRVRDDLAIFVEDDRDVDQLLAALDLRHDRHTSSFVVESAPLRTAGMARLVRALVFLGGALLAGAVIHRAYRQALVGFALVPVLMIYSMILRRARRTTRVLVGSDGILVRVAGVLRQIRFPSVAKATAKGTDVLLQLDTAEALVLRFVGDAADRQALAFASRVQASVARLDQAKPDPVAALLLPAGRSTRDWLVDIKTIAGDGPRGSAGGYRGRTIPEEDLWRIVENGGADAGARAAALAALQPRLGEEGRVRIAQLAGGTAHPDVRAALEAAAGGADDEQILEVFGQRSRR